MNRLNSEIHQILTDDVAQALYSKQIYTVLDFIKADTQQITKCARLNFKEVLAVKNYLLKKFSAAPINGYDFYKNTLKNTAIISTGIKSVDCLLNGGFFTGNIYEICGPPGNGKTLFILSLIKNIIKNTSQNVYLFDTKNDFSVRRIQSMLKKEDKEDQKSDDLSRILVSRIFSRHDLLNSLHSIKNEGNISKLRLIVIDSLPMLLLNSNDRSQNNTFLNQLVNVMRYLATEHHIALLITNLITRLNDEIQQANSEQITCGKYWFNVPNTRLKIEKRTNFTEVTLLKSNSVPNKVNCSANILLTNEGFS